MNNSPLNRIDRAPRAVSQQCRMREPNGRRYYAVAFVRLIEKTEATSLTWILPLVSRRRLSNYYFEVMRDRDTAANAMVRAMEDLYRTIQRILPIVVARDTSPNTVRGKQ